MVHETQYCKILLVICRVTKGLAKLNQTDLHTQCIPAIRPTVLSNENWTYKWVGLMSE